MVLDILGSSSQVAQSPCPIDHQQSLDQILGRAIKMARTPDLARQYPFVRSQVRVVVKRRVPSQHLKDQHAQRPPVRRLPVPFALDDLRRKVLWRAAQRPRPVRHLLREPKVRDPHMPLRVQQNVLRLQVAVHHVFAVKIP